MSKTINFLLLWQRPPYSRCPTLSTKVPGTPPASYNRQGRIIAKINFY